MSSTDAAAGIAGAKSFRTGVSAFPPGIAKLMVPMVFVCSPNLLIVLDGYFTWVDFLTTTLTCAFGAFMVATGVAGCFIGLMPPAGRAVVFIAGILMVAPSLESDFWPLTFAVPVLQQQTCAFHHAADREGEFVLGPGAGKASGPQLVWCDSTAHNAAKAR